MKLRWGILGIGKIAHKFVEDLLLLENMTLQSVASRSTSKAAMFKDKYNAKIAYGDYESLFKDSEVDIVYIATPHHAHMEWSIKAMDAGKHVLCEKPIAVNGEQFQLMNVKSKEKNVFLMEALWSRFNPTLIEVLSQVKANAIGQVNYLNAEFSFVRNFPPENRAINLNLAGGSLLDLGIYPAFLAYCIFGMPNEILASSRFNSSGSDEQTLAILRYEFGFAYLMSGFQSQTNNVAKICGDDGMILIDSRWHNSEAYKLISSDGSIESFSKPIRGHGYTYEIEECYKCIQANQTESKLWSHEDSDNLIAILDEIRKQIGLKYPFE